MTAAARPAAAPARHGLAAAILLAGLAGGAVDFVYASGVGLIHGRGVEKVWQGVAGGWLGEAAGEGGLATAALGVATHFGIATAMAAAYALAATRLKLLTERPLLSGALYGLALYVVMYRIVLPLRFAAVFPRWDGLQSFADIASHLGVGLAIALVLSRSVRPSLKR